MERADRHRWARGVLLRAWSSLFPHDSPDATELQTIQAQGALEGFYGWATHPPQWAGSNNWGAVDWTPTNGGAHFGGLGAANGSFVAPDHKADGTPIFPQFKSYATPEDGAADLLYQALVMRPNVANVLDSGDLGAYARELRAAHYFGAPADAYARGLFTNARELASALGEPLAVALDGDVTPASSRRAPSNAIGLLFVAGGALALAYPRTRRMLLGA